MFRSRRVESGGIGLGFLDRQPDPRSLNPVNQLEPDLEDLSRGRLGEALAILEESERSIIMMCHARHSCSLAEAARRLGISISRARQLHDNAKAKIFVVYSTSIQC